MALGEAFITIRADTSKFKQDLSTQLKATLADAQKKTDGYTKSQVDAAKKANQAIVSAEKDAYKERDAMAKAAANGKLAAEKAYEKEFKALLDSETKASAQAAKAASAAQIASDRETQAALKQGSAAIAAAERAMYDSMKLEAKTAAAEQIAAQRAVSAAAKEAAVSQAASMSGLTSFANNANSAVGSLGSAITKSIVYPLAAIGASAAVAGTAIGFFGIKSAGTIQSLQVAFEGIIGAQKEFNGDLAAGQKAGDQFFAALQQFAKVTPFRFKDLGAAAQQLLGIGLKGPQVLGTLTDIGNSLALTGNLSSDRLNNVVLALTQINALGKVTRDNIRQITSNVPTFNQEIFVQQIAALQAIKDRGPGAVATTADLAKAQKDLGNGAVPASIGVQAVVNTMRETPGAAGAMERSMTTLTGVLSNFQDAAQIALTNAFLPQLPAIQKALTDFTPILADGLTKAAESVGQFITALGPFIDQVFPAFIGVVQPVLNIMQRLLIAFGPLLVGILNVAANVFAALEQPISVVAQAFTDALLPVLPTLTAALVQLAPSLAELATALIPLAPLLVTIVSDGIKVLAEILPGLVPLIQLFSGALTAILQIPGAGIFFGAMALGLGAIALVLPTILELFGGLAIILTAVTGEAVTTGAAIGVAMDLALGPVGLVIGAITLITIGFAEAWAHSETFRRVTVAALNFVIDAIGLLAKAIFDLTIGPFKIMLEAIRGVASLGAKLGIPLAKSVKNAANSAIGDIDSVSNAIGSIRDKNVTINVTTKLHGPTPQELAKMFGSNDINDPDGAFASAAAVSAATAIGGVTPTDNLGGTGGDTTTGNDAAKNKAAAAAAKAKAAAEKIKTALADLKGDFKAIGDATSKLTAAQIKTNFNALIKDLKDSGHKALAAQAKIIEDQLIADAKKLKTKQDTLAAELAIAQPIKNSVIDLGNISTPTQGIGQTFLGIENQLNGAIAKAQAFGSAVKSLQREGLDPALLKQIIDAGPVAGYTAAQALLSGGQAGINLINGKQAILTGLGNDLANQVTPELFEAGKHVGDGLLEGLKSQEQALASEMDHIADLMIKAFNKKIGAHSPSTVFATGGDNIAAGLAMGLDRSNGTISGAMGRVSSTVINFGAGSIAVNGSVPRPESTGMLLGSGLTSVLAGRQTQAALNGTG